MIRERWRHITIIVFVSFTWLFLVNLFLAFASGWQMC